jgi:hypothetical protein
MGANSLIVRAASRLSEPGAPLALRRRLKDKPREATLLLCLSGIAISAILVRTALM